jgi:hypothetical protein
LLGLCSRFEVYVVDDVSFGWWAGREFIFEDIFIFL